MNSVPVRTLVLASGRGSNFRAILDAKGRKELPKVELVACLLDRPGTGAESIAREAGIPVRLVNYADYSARPEFDAALERNVIECEPDLILTLGFMRILSPDLVSRFSGKILNVHPALLPAFTGMRAQRQALDYGVRISGATVHYMDSGVDTGPIVAQSAVRIAPDLDEEGLSALILIEEHKLIVEAVRLHVDGRLKIEGRRVRILEKENES